MLLQRRFQLLVLLSAGFSIVAVVFFALVAEKTYHKKDNFFLFFMDSYELVLAGIENGNLTLESNNLLLTLHKWSAFLNDMISTNDNANRVIKKHDGGELIMHTSSVLAIEHSCETHNHLRQLIECF